MTKHFLPALISALVLAPLASSNDARDPMSLPLPEFKAAVKKNVDYLAEPMIGLANKKRTKVLREIVSKCRKKVAYRACIGGDQKSCAQANNCPIQDMEEARFIEPSQKLLLERADEVEKNFNSKLKGNRRGFAIGTINKLIDQHNNAVAELTSLQSKTIPDAIESCAKAYNDKSPQQGTRCLYDRLEQLYVAAARSIDSHAKKLRLYIDRQIALRIKNYKE